MFRLVVVVLAMVGLYTLFGGFGLLFLPILFFGLMMFGVAGCRMRGRNQGSSQWEPAWRGRPARQEPSREERFDEWHRIAHARDEVDSWVDGMSDTGQD